MATDLYKGVAPHLMAGPMIAGAVATPSQNDLPNVSRAIYVGGAGNLELIMANGSTLLLTAVPAGSFLPIRAQRITANTTATNIVALW